MAMEITLRDVLILGAFLLVRDGLPWLMRTVFPAWHQQRTAKDAGELSLRREVAEREIELKREIAERDQIIENRNTRAIEAIESYIQKMVELISAQAVQMTAMGHEIKSMRMEASDYYREGRRAIKDIAVMSVKNGAKSTRKPRKT